MSYFLFTVLYCQILVHLNNRCLPDVLNDIVTHGAHDPEEFPFIEEIHILRRLQATYFACRNWVETKSSINIQAWKVSDFFIINHSDLARMLPSFDLLQVHFGATNKTKYINRLNCYTFWDTHISLTVALFWWISRIVCSAPIIPRMIYWVV